jgi:hypothetical protein
MTRKSLALATPDLMCPCNWRESLKAASGTVLGSATPGSSRNREL